jgi:sugar lactone lactonase YvrE
VKHDLNNVSYNSHIKTRKNEVYFTPHLEDYGYYYMLRIDLNNYSTKKIKLHGEEICFDKYDNELIEGDTDFKGNSWFSILNYNFDEENYYNNHKVYKLLRINNEGKVEEFFELKSKSNIFYNDAFTDMTIDKNNNLWFKITEYDYLDNSTVYKLGRINEKGDVKFYRFHDAVINYCILKNGDIWAVEGGNKVLHINGEGSLIEKFQMNNVTDITIDENDDIWIIHEDSIKKLENNYFSSKYNIQEGMNKLSVLNDNKMMAAGVKGFSLIDGDSIENITVDNYIDDSAFVISDGSGNIKILSAEEDRWHIKKAYRDEELSITEISGQNEFQKECLKGGKYLPYFSSKLYKNHIYIPVDNIIYKVNRGQKEEYIDLDSCGHLNSLCDEYLKNLEIDDYGNVYAVSDNKLYKISSTKEIKYIGVNEITENLDIDGYKVYKKLLKDNNGNIYVVVNIDEYEILYNVCNLYRIKQVSELIYKKDGFEYYPLNIFTNENNEIEGVYRQEGCIRVYKLKGKLQEDVRFKGENEYVTKGFTTISKMVKSADGKVFAIMYGNSLVVKDKKGECFYEIRDLVAYNYVNSIEVDQKGTVYIGTYDSGVICYRD